MNNAYIETSYLQADDALWLRGNLHTHTTRSDGSGTPQQMVTQYAKLGYDFLMLSDHDIMSDNGSLDNCGLILIDAVEVCGGPHVLDAGARKLVARRPDIQSTIDEINRESGIPILCHPNWEENFDHYPYARLEALQNYAGIEIFNGVVIDLAGNHLATDKWDRLLAAGRQVWGYANDDAHAVRQIGRGWNVVSVNQRTPSAILSALRTGSFYASSGVQISQIRVQGPRLHIEAPNADSFAVFGRHGCRLAFIEGSALDYDASELTHPFFRVECYGRRNSTAWTQPFVVRKGQ